MRTSFLSRSVIAVASLAIGSVALAATPATAATSSGVTRDMVLTAVNGLRLDDPTEPQYMATSKALRSIANRACGVDADTEILYSFNPQLLTPGDDAEGVVIQSEIDSLLSDTSRYCSFAAFVTADASFQLSGSASLTGQKYLPDSDEVSDVVSTLTTAALSGDVFVSAPFDFSVYASDYANLTVSASGNATKTTSVTTSEKVATPKTTKQKKAAKKAYDKKLKAAKKSYTKALKKAGKSKSKKAAAKKAYSKKKASAKATYKTAIAGFKIVKKTTSNVENRPFSITMPQSS